MSIAMGSFGWMPAAFWAATPHDLYAVCEFNERQEARRKAAEKG
jgi:hypothetical protein